MIRIVGVERSMDPLKEAVLMQNQGVMRVNLKGHALLASCAEGSCAWGSTAHVFTEDVELPAGTFVWVVTGEASSGWSRTRDGHHVYRTSLHRDESVWSDEYCVLHLLAPQHTFCPRSRAAAVSAI